MWARPDISVIFISVMGEPVRTPRWVLLLQMRQDQPLPVTVQHVLAAPGGRHHAAALGQGLQQQMHLSIVAQRLKVPHALHRGGDGLLLCKTRPRSSSISTPKRSDTRLFENFRLDAAHQGHMNFPSVGGEAQLGVLLLQLAQLGQQGAAVAVRRQGHPIAHHRLQHRPDAGFLRPRPWPPQVAVSPWTAHTPPAGTWSTARNRPPL